MTLHSFNALCTRKGWRTGRTGCFPKGNIPYNLGMARPFNANTARTQFKPGNLPHNMKYLGHERLSKEGYIEISVAKTNPHTGFDRDYVLKHRYLWEQRNGPIPDGHVLKCLDGNRLNTDPSNWVLVPRAMLPLLNGRYGADYDRAPSDVKPAVLALARVKYALLQKRSAS
ncbi:MAG: HNH endonuclease signature motif containing protein [Nitrospiraceae bacterium]